MTVMECYAALEGDYESVLGRMRSEKLVKKFVFKFLADPSFENLKQALAEGKQEEAFRAAHTLKGMCLNLGFTRLGNSSEALTEAVRHAITPEADHLLEVVAADYEMVAAAIRALEASEA